MIINSFQINDKSQLMPLAPERAAEVAQNKNARIWLDVQTTEPAKLEKWLDTLEIRAFSRRLCLEASDRSGYYPLKKEIFLVIPVLADIKGPPERDYLALLCRENLLLSFHRKSIFNPQQLATLHEAEDWLPDRSVAGLVSAVTLDLSQECLGQVAGMRTMIHALEERMDSEPDTVEAQEYMNCALANLQAADRSLDRLGERISALRAGF